SYFSFHPEDKAVRDRLIALALPHAQVPPPVASVQAGAAAAPSFIGVAAAWDILLKTGVLHDGMTPSEAAGILGEPTQRAPNRVPGDVNSPGHVNQYTPPPTQDGNLHGGTGETPSPLHPPGFLIFPRRSAILLSMNIVLIGYRGSGKSSIGRKLASKL